MAWARRLYKRAFVVVTGSLLNGRPVEYVELVLPLLSRGCDWKPKAASKCVQIIYSICVPFSGKIGEVYRNWKGQDCDSAHGVHHSQIRGTGATPFQMYQRHSWSSSDQIACRGFPKIPRSILGAASKIS